MTTRIFSTCILMIFILSARSQYTTKAQQLITNEDSLNHGLNNNKTLISGYGSAYYQRDFNAMQSTITLERAVIFVGHQFSERISFFSELEVENAKVEGGTHNEGEIAMEQAYLKFNLNAKNYLVAGLFVPRIGILNENHLPVNFNGVERPLVESLIIPATWRELGLAWYGSSAKLPINYSVALVNGLNSAHLEHGSGIREARAEGSMAQANNIALTASVQYLWNDFKFQISGYAGGTVGLNHAEADSLGLRGGAFGTPIYIGEANLQYVKGGFSAKALYSRIYYPQAGKINLAYDNNTATGMYGSYIEAAYDLLYHLHKKAQLNSFVRTEFLDMNASLPSGAKAVYDGIERQTHIIAGFGYLPLPNVVIKADIRIMHTGQQNPELANGSPYPSPYRQNNQFLNVGIGYSF